MERRLLIGGELVAGDGAVLSVENPFTQTELAQVAAASTAQVGAAVARAGEGAKAFAALTAGARGVA